MTQRTDRVDELLRQEIGTILSREAKDPRIGFATITDVETTPDLRHARVWVSVIGPTSERDEAIAALQRTMHFVRRELGTRLRLKRIPELHVRLDDSAERGTRVLHLLQELDGGRAPDELETLEPLPTPVRRLAHEGDAPEGDAPESDAPESDATESDARGAPEARRAGGAMAHAKRRGGHRHERRSRGSRDR